MTDVRGRQVTLRTPRADDLDALWAVRLSDDGPAGRTPEAREQLRKRLAKNVTLADDGWLDFAIDVDGRIVGDIQARAPKRAIPPGVCEIGISLLPEARGRGYGTEAVHLFTTHLFEQGLARVQASTAVGNAAMRRVLERLGYGFEGVLRDFMPAGDGGREDYALYAATARTWRR